MQRSSRGDTPVPPNTSGPSASDPSPAMLDRFLTGECSGEAADAVRSWLAQSPDHAAQLDQLRQLREVAGQQVVWNLRGMWEHVTNNIATAEPDGVFAERLQRQRPAEVPFSPPTPPRPRRSTYITSPVRQVTFAATALLLALIAWNTRHIFPQFGSAFTSSATHAVAREYITTPGQIASLTLPDGSHAVLGVASRLRYTSDNDNHTRAVFLDGEAYLTVAHNSAAPFVVHAGNTTAQDLGTAFSVRAYPGDTTVQIVVTEGRVAFRLSTQSPRNSTTLTRGDLAVMPPSGITAVTHGISNADATAWTHGELQFAATPLSQVLPELHRWYGLQITLAEPALASAWVTATFRADESPSEVATRLAEILALRIHRSSTSLTLVR